jgi:hypothetical protein
MRTLATIIGTVAGVMPVTSAFAASGASEDNSGILATIFFGLCAIIVVGQLVPSLMVMLGFIRGLRKETKSETA